MINFRANRQGAGQDDGVEAGVPGPGGDDDLVTGADFQGGDGAWNGRGAGGDFE